MASVPTTRRRGLPRPDWLAVALLRNRLTELERADVLDTLAAHARSTGEPVTDGQIAATVDRIVGVTASASDVALLRAELARVGWPLSA